MLTFAIRLSGIALSLCQFSNICVELIFFFFVCLFVLITPDTAFQNVFLIILCGIYEVLISTMYVSQDLKRSWIKHFQESTLKNFQKDFISYHYWFIYSMVCLFIWVESGIPLLDFFPTSYSSENRQTCIRSVKYGNRKGFFVS